MEGAPLVALSFKIYRAIGNATADKAAKWLSSLCQKLGYDQAAYDEMVEQAIESYNKDRGRVLLESAFPDWTD